METELLPIQSCIISITEYAALIERIYKDILKPPRKGIYKLGELHPTIYDNKRYWTIKDGAIFPIGDFESTTTPVIDEDGNVILSKYIMTNKRKFLSASPTLPVIGSAVIKALIEYHISTISPWTKTNGYKTKLLSLFNDYVDEDHLIDLCISIIQQINSFIGDDEWNIYFVKFIGLDICIDKSIDYRIYEFTKWTNAKSVQEIQSFCDS